MKAKKPTLNPLNKTNLPGYKWRVRFTESGQRRERIFKTKVEARKFLADKEVEFANLGTSYSDSLTDRLKREAVEASRRLSEVNATIPEAVEFFLKHLAERRRSKEIGESVSEWLELRRKDGSRGRTIGNLESRSRYLVEEFKGRLVAEIGTHDIVSWLEGVEGSSQTRKHYRAVASAFFGWAKLRGLTVANPVADVPIPKVDAKDPEIFTPAQMTAMLEAASKADTDEKGEEIPSPRLIAYLALCGFAGLRAEEAERLRWEDIDFEHETIDIRPAVSKTGQGRDVPLEQNAMQWLLPVRQKKGRILVDRWLDKQVVRDFKANLSTEEMFGKVFEWPQNGLRHSYATYHLYRGMDAGKTAMALGHNGNPQMLFRHYRKRVKTAVAEKWFEISPEEADKKVVSIAGQFQ